MKMTFLAMDKDTDFETAGAKIYRFTIAQSATDWKEYNWERRIWMHRLVTVESGLR
jgi:hypothetical protein